MDGQALLAFDVGSRAQFEQLDAWAQEAAKYGARDMSVVVCANKVGRPRQFWIKKHSRNIAGIAKLQKACKNMTGTSRTVVLLQTDNKNREVKPKEAQAWAAKNGYM